MQPSAHGCVMVSLICGLNNHLDTKSAKVSSYPDSSALQVEAHVEDAIAKGAKVLTGGKRPALDGPLGKGYFFEPTVLGDASIDMRIYKEETFGPAVPCFKFKHDGEAIKLANDSEYGLAAYFYTKVSVAH